MSAKKNPQRYVSDGQLQAIKRGISRELFEGFEVVWMTVMRDKFGFGADRLAEIMQDTHAIGEALIDDKISTDSMIVDLAYLRGIQVTEPDFIRRPISSGETYWTAADLALTGGRMYRESDLRNLRIRAERDTWVICEAIWLYTLQLPRRPQPPKAAADFPADTPQEESQKRGASAGKCVSKRRDTFGTDRLRRAQAEARALGGSMAERRITVQELRDVLRDEAHIVLQRPEPREKEIEKASTASGGRVKMPFSFEGVTP